MTESSSVQSHGVKILSLVEKGKEKAVAATASAEGAPAAPEGKGKGKVGGSERLKANDICMHCQGKGH
ncbi:UNVERIFIED_CONTAM: hypothetical protein Slati_3802800 [Sesamum latifolium]|uniref:Uncharacterized protein n=1 Tax=Sesamum latifolium TaxID=2727402 RepID=A0AAW2U427_9LAMI